MPRSEAMNKAIKKYEEEKVERIMIRVRKGEKAKIEAHAKDLNESTNSFINRAIRQTMHEDIQKVTKKQKKD